MHSVIMIKDEASLEELNQLLAEGDWWVHKVATGNDGAWLVVVTDQDPDAMPFEEELACEGHEH